MSEQSKLSKQFKEKHNIVAPEQVEVQRSKFSRPVKEDVESTYLKLDEDGKFELISIISDCKKVDVMAEKNYIPFFYNGCYGGASGLSECIIDVMNIIYSFLKKDEYTEEELELKNKFIYSNIKEDRYIKKIILAKVLEFLDSDEIRTHFSYLCYEFVDLKYYNYIEKDEYDGMETLRFNMDKYKVTEIKKILDSYLTLEQQLETISEIVNSEPNPIE
jgi:hypothetical protein